MARRNLHQRTECPFELAMDLLSGKWKGMIIFKLKDATYRFNELKNLIPNISTRMLILALRELEEDGLVIKTPHPTNSIIVSYHLSSIAHQLIPILMHMRDWGCSYLALHPKQHPETKN